MCQLCDFMVNLFSSIVIINPAAVYLFFALYKTTYVDIAIMQIFQLYTQFLLIETKNIFIPLLSTHIIITN